MAQLGSGTCRTLVVPIVVRLADGPTIFRIVVAHTVLSVGGVVLRPPCAILAQGFKTGETAQRVAGWVGGGVADFDNGLVGVGHGIFLSELNCYLIVIYELHGE